MPFCRGHVVFLPFGRILKSLAGLSCRPPHEVGLLKVQTGAEMDKGSDRKVTEGRDAFAHFTILPGRHSLIL